MVSPAQPGPPPLQSETATMFRVSPFPIDNCFDGQLHLIGASRWLQIRVAVGGRVDHHLT